MPPTASSELGIIVELYKLLSAGTLPMLLLLIVYGSNRGIFYWAREYNALKDDRDAWRDVARTAKTNTEGALQAVHKVVEVMR